MSEEVQCKEEAQGRQDSVPIPASRGGAGGEPMPEVGVSVGPAEQETGESPKSMPVYKSRSEGSRCWNSSEG